MEMSHPFTNTSRKTLSKCRTQSKDSGFNYRSHVFKSIPSLKLPNEKMRKKKKFGACRKITLKTDIVKYMREIVQIYTMIEVLG